MKPSGSKIVWNDKFSQKVRNLKAHNTFERLGYAKYDAQKGGKVAITLEGIRHLDL